MKRNLDSELRSLDAAPEQITTEEQKRAEAALERIVATETQATNLRPEHPIARTRYGMRRIVIVPAAAVALILSIVLVQITGSSNAAYASWTAIPDPLLADDLAIIETACQRQIDSYFAESDNPELVLSERRGEHAALLYRTDNPDMTASCLVLNPKGSTRVSDIETGAGGSSGPAQKASPEGFTQGPISGRAVGNNEGFSITSGAVGDKVEAVTIHAGETTVEASVQNGRYAAWWPGPAFADNPAPPSGQWSPENILTYDLTLENGTVIRDAQPELPS